MVNCDFFIDLFTNKKVINIIAIFIKIF